MAAATLVLMTVAAATVLVPAIENRIVYGTFDTQGPPPDAARAQHRTSVCSMEVWVETGADALRPYTLSGGP